jgi:hypothetical protein
MADNTISGGISGPSTGYDPSLDDLGGVDQTGGSPYPQQVEQYGEPNLQEVQSEYQQGLAYQSQALQTIQSGRDPNSGQPLTPEQKQQWETYLNQINSWLGEAQGVLNELTLESQAQKPTGLDGSPLQEGAGSTPNIADPNGSVIYEDGASSTYTVDGHDTDVRTHNFYQKDNTLIIPSNAATVKVTEQPDDAFPGRKEIVVTVTPPGKTTVYHNSDRAGFKLNLQVADKSQIDPPLSGNLASKVTTAQLGEEGSVEVANAESDIPPTEQQPDGTLVYDQPAGQVVTFQPQGSGEPGQVQNHEVHGPFVIIPKASDDVTVAPTSIGPDGKAKDVEVIVKHRDGSIDRYVGNRSKVDIESQYPIDYRTTPLPKAQTGLAGVYQTLVGVAAQRLQANITLPAGLAARASAAAGTTTDNEVPDVLKDIVSVNNPEALAPGYEAGGAAGAPYTPTHVNEDVPTKEDTKTKTRTYDAGQKQDGTSSFDIYTRSDGGTDNVYAQDVHLHANSFANEYWKVSYDDTTKQYKVEVYDNANYTGDPKETFNIDGQAQNITFDIPANHITFGDGVGTGNQPNPTGPNGAKLSLEGAGATTQATTHPDATQPDGPITPGTDAHSGTATYNKSDNVVIYADPNDAASTHEVYANDVTIHKQDNTSKFDIERTQDGYTVTVKGANGTTIETIHVHGKNAKVHIDGSAENITYKYSVGGKIQTSNYVSGADPNISLTTGEADATQLPDTVKKIEDWLRANGAPNLTGYNIIRIAQSVGLDLTAPLPSPPDQKVLNFLQKVDPKLKGDIKKYYDARRSSKDSHQPEQDAIKGRVVSLLSQLYPGKSISIVSGKEDVIKFGDKNYRLVNEGAADDGKLDDVLSFEND